MSQEMSQTMPTTHAQDPSETEAGLRGQLCDFCGDTVSSVRRVALDQDYDRLLKTHRERFSCADCFEKKEQERLGLAPR